jgi:hypothetical protein
VALTNTGNAVANISSIGVSGSNSSDFGQSNTCGASLAVGANCTVNLTFAPTGGGVRTAMIVVSDNVSGPAPAINLTGIGLAPVASLSPTSLTFNAQTVGSKSASQSVTLTNASSAALQISQISASGDYSQSNNCGASLAAGAACQIAVTFAPTASGARTGTLTITDNAAGSPQSVPLSGTGSSLGLMVAAGSSNSATVSAGGSASYSLSIGGAGSTAMVSLTCTGAPKGANCSLPASMSVSGTSASTFMVNVTTTSRIGAALFPVSVPAAWLWAMVLFGLVIPAENSKQEGLRSRTCRLVLPLLFGLLLMGGCGGGSSSVTQPNPNPNSTPVGTYTLTVMAAAADGTSQSVPLTLIVQ